MVHLLKPAQDRHIDPGTALNSLDETIRLVRRGRDRACRIKITIYGSATQHGSCRNPFHKLPTAAFGTSHPTYESSTVSPITLNTGP